MSKYYLILAIFAVWAFAFIPAPSRGVYPIFLNLTLLPLAVLAYLEGAGIVITAAAAALTFFSLYAFKIKLDFVAAVPIFFAFGLTPVTLGVLRRAYRDMETMLTEGLLKNEDAGRLLTDKNLKLQEGLRGLDEKVSDIASLYEITKAMSATLSFPDTARVLGEFLRKNFDFKDCKLIFIDEEKNQIDKIYRIETGLPVASNPGPEDKAILSEVLNAKRIMHKDDIIAVPLVSRGRMIGALNIKGLSQAALEKFLIVSRQFSLAIKKVRMYERIQELAITDGLTGIFVRRYFLQELDEEFVRASRHKFKLSFLMIDLDHFKECNDKFGHLIGDAMLKETARVLKHNIREVDLIGRYGGEEFSVILPEADRVSAGLVAERLRRAVEANIFKAYDEVLHMTISVGVATFPQDASRSGDLIEQADKALYSAKAEGRNRVVFSGRVQ
ncbi:MAG: sensor domain-containing diguanylate cyclase [Candidatus Omnitrophica bacterium]|nr:sensor domain-containing diguanylate cyclase [Candidatus Omnitrophota bacterium]